jgi:REP element-mobilizing transposase RayT
MSGVREYPQRLHHRVPGWVRDGATFHVRLRVAPDQPFPLVRPETAPELLASARNYHDRQVWWCDLFLLMPDHIHALISFPGDVVMAKVLGAWKRYVNRTVGVRWQPNFFDHRLRSNQDFAATWAYILRNPVVKGLAENEQSWPWVWCPKDAPNQPDGDVGLHLEPRGS